MHRKKAIDYSKYEDVVDTESVDNFIRYVNKEMHIETIKGIDKLKNGINANKIVTVVNELSGEYGIKFTGLSLINYGKELTAAETYGKELKLNIEMLNKPDAFKDVLQEWANKGYIPKGCNNIEYIGRHEYFHLFTQDAIDKPHSKVKTLILRYTTNGGEYPSENSHDDIHEFAADLLSSRSLSKLQNKLKTAIIKAVKEG